MRRPGPFTSALAVAAVSLTCAAACTSSSTAPAASQPSRAPVVSAVKIVPAGSVTFVPHAFPAQKFAASFPSAGVANFSVGPGDCGEGCTAGQAGFKAYAVMYQTDVNAGKYCAVTVEQRMHLLDANSNQCGAEQDFGVTVHSDKKYSDGDARTIAGVDCYDTSPMKVGNASGIFCDMFENTPYAIVAYGGRLYIIWAANFDPHDRVAQQFLQKIRFG